MAKDLGGIQETLALRNPVSGILSRERNLELVLLAGSAAFAVIAWRALEAASFTMPEGSQRIVSQFLIITLLGHVGLRIVAPHASAHLYAVAALLVAVGLAFVTRLSPDSAQDQANWATVGIVLMVVTAALSPYYRRLGRYRYTAALIALALLIGTGLVGDTINGARLWVTLAGQTIQTTELIKLFMIVFLAGYLADQADVLGSSRLRFAGRTYSALPYLIPLAGVLLLTVAALALLRDLGSVAILLLLAIGVLYLATGRAWYVAAGLGLLLAAGALGYVAFDHAQLRIDIWLDPNSDPQGAGYQTLQSTFAFQAGGVTGEGLGLGSPDVIPAAPTDYVFSAIGEELGLAGATGVVLLFVLLVFGGLQVAMRARDDFSRLLACSTAVLFGVQAAVIIAGNLRLIPTTGITLPFVSYGGSSLVVNFLLLGLLLGISNEARRRDQL